MILRGLIRDLDPVVKATIRMGTLRLGARGGMSFVVDTGFNGSVSAPPAVLRRLGVRKEGFQRFRLADGSTVRLAVYSGSVDLGVRRVPAWFVPGEPLLGMEFLSSVASTLTLHFRRGTLGLR